MYQQRASKRPLKITVMMATAISALILTVQPAFAAEQEAISPLLNCSLPTNCVNSRTSEGLVPLRFTGNNAQGLALLKTTLASFPEASIKLESESSIKAVFTTPVGFKDDVIFLIDAQRQQIDFQSHSGFGLYDFGKNRARMQAVGARFAKEAAAAAAAAAAIGQ